VSARAGAIIALPSGSSATIPPGALPADQSVTFYLASSMSMPPPGDLLQPIGPVIGLIFDATSSGQALSVKQSALAATDLAPIVLTTGLGNPRPVGAADAGGVASAVDLSHGQTFVGIPGEVDVGAGTVAFQVPGAAAPELKSIEVSLATLNTVPAPRFGGRIWSPSAGNWVALPDDLPADFSGKKTLVITHGILSSVENAYGACINDIMAAGNYDQVVGFDYDWTDGVDANGQKYAAFLDRLTTAGVQEVDMEAHSYGTVVSLSAASRSGLHIHNMVLEGGPCNGTPVADRALVKALGIAHVTDFLAPQTTLRDLLQSPMLTDLQPGGAVLEQVRTDFNNAHGDTNVIKIVGNLPTTPATAALLGIPFDLPFDGIIPASSAACPGVGAASSPPPQTFGLNHIELPCPMDKSTINAVAGLLQQWTPAPPAQTDGSTMNPADSGSGGGGQGGDTGSGGAGGSGGGTVSGGSGGSVGSGGGVGSSNDGGTSDSPPQCDSLRCNQICLDNLNACYSPCNTFPCLNACDAIYNKCPSNTDPQTCMCIP
jgi:pimeloyl-ACP methyl ester carboxylesterase